MVKRQVARRLDPKYLLVSGILPAYLKTIRDDTLVWLSPRTGEVDAKPGVYVKLTMQETLSGGDVIAPHLYDWIFDGVDDFVQIPYSESLNYGNKFTVSLTFHVTEEQATRRIFEHGGDYNSISYWGSGIVRWYTINEDGDTVYIDVSGISIGEWYYVTVTYDKDAGSDNAKMYVNGALKSSKTQTGTIDIDGKSINLAKHLDSYFKGFISFNFISNRILDGAEILESYDNHIVNASGLVLFLDPTFYNGTHFVDLSPYGNHGTPYNGVKRVGAEEKWLWLIKNLETEDLHFKWFPIGTYIRIVQGTRIINEFVITGQTTPAGQVEDYAVDAPGETVTIEAYVPVEKMAVQVKLVEKQRRTRRGYTERTAWVVDDIGARMLCVETSWSIS
ncbi:MAG: hypothetical protein DRG33_04585 [Deltaproteobacteria bacterium]|nr:MAG: hypothetical protein DRG33_04585 [Deltaproteobacteria bacterium]